MGVTSVEKQLGQTGSDAADGGKLKVIYFVETSSRGDDFETVLGAGDLPQRGDAHPTMPLLFCVSRTATEVAYLNNEDQTASGSRWRVEIDYSSLQTEVETAVSPLYPTRPPQYKLTRSVEEVTTDCDVNGNPIKNFAGDPLKPPLKRRVSVRRLEITVNLLLADCLDPDAYEDHTNSGTFKGKAAGTWFCEGIEIQGPVKENGVEYYTQTAVLAYRKNGWKRKWLNEGLREKVGGTGDPKPIVVDGVEVTEPLPLNPDGSAIKDGNLAGATFSETVLEPSASFAALDY